MRNPLEIIYLHIPKTSGTSQLELLYDVYGEKAVFWHGAKNKGSLDNAIVVGGHQPVKYYQPLPPLLYISIVREPTERVLSFYNWISNPLHGKDSIYQERLDLQQQWITKGLDPKSIENTLIECKHFREAIKNNQCRYLSLYGASLDGVIKTLSTSSWIIGTQNNISLFTDFLTRTLGVTTNKNHQINRASNPDKALKTLSPASQDMINELTIEDKRLYNFIKNDCDELYYTIQNIRHLPQKVLVKPETKKKYKSYLSFWMSSNLSILKKAYIELREKTLEFQPGHIHRLNVVIHNRSNRHLNPLLNNGTYVTYEIYDVNHQCIYTHGDNSLLLDVIPPKSSRTLAINVRIPYKLVNQAYYLKPGILQEGHFHSHQQSDWAYLKFRGQFT